MSALFRPLQLRAVEIRNRIGVSPMCQYSSEGGLAHDWHLVHLGQFATGGAGLVFTEATAVLPEGRISPADLGIWDDAHIPMLRRITQFLRTHGAVAAIQLAHAGRKASTAPPWEGGALVPPDGGGWEKVVAPSALAYSDRMAVPEALSLDGMREVTAAFVQAAERALAAGFQLIELHAAHGYLLHEFLSPLSNMRTDAYGGSFENRTRFLRETVRAVRAVWPDTLPLAVRISATDWADGGWTIDESVQLSKLLHADGVDLIDCTSGGLASHQQIPVAPGYQVPFAERISRETRVAVAAVGLITEPAQANTIIEDGAADIVLLAREMLRDPHWPLRAAHALGETVTWPVQYQRAPFR